MSILCDTLACRWSFSGGWFWLLEVWCVRSFCVHRRRPLSYSRFVAGHFASLSYDTTVALIHPPRECASCAPPPCRLVSRANFLARGVRLWLRTREHTAEEEKYVSETCFFCCPMLSVLWCYSTDCRIRWHDVVYVLSISGLSLTISAVLLSHTTLGGNRSWSGIEGTFRH